MPQTDTRPSWVRKNRLWLILAGLVVLVVFFVLVSRRQPVARVAVVDVVRGDLSSAITTNGKIEPVEPHMLRARMATFVTRVLAVEGQHVKRGQLLLTLDAEQARADLAQAQDGLLAAQKRLKDAQSGGPPDQVAQTESGLRKAEIERDRWRAESSALERLVQTQAATKDELAQSRIRLESAEAEWQRAKGARDDLARRAKLDIEREQLQIARFRDQIQDLQQKVRSARVVAPTEGILYSLPVHVRDFVQTGDLLAAVADLHRIRVRAFVDEPELGSLESGQTVEVTWDALPNRIWTGRTEQVPRQVVPLGTRSVGEVLCPVPNQDLALLPNVSVDVKIHLRERRNVLIIPRGAVDIEGTNRYVYVVASAGALSVDQRLEKRPIQIGISNLGSYEVTGGVKEGEKLALPGAVNLRDGMTVRIAQSQ